MHAGSFPSSVINCSISPSSWKLAVFMKVIGGYALYIDPLASMNGNDFFSSLCDVWTVFSRSTQ